MDALNWLSPQANINGGYNSLLKAYSEALITMKTTASQNLKWAVLINRMDWLQRKLTNFNSVGYCSNVFSFGTHKFITTSIHREFRLDLA